MMDGIRILNETIVYCTRPSYFEIIVVAILVGLVFFVLGILVTEDFIIGLMGAIASILITFPVAYSNVLYDIPTDEIDYIMYDVTIDDSVSLTEFHKKYKILEINGEIYTITEQNN